MGNNSERIQALKTLDIALDDMMAKESKKFAASPSPAGLDIIYKLMDVDKKVDECLEKAGEKPVNMYTGMNQNMSGNTNTTTPGTLNNHPNGTVTPGLMKP